MMNTNHRGIWETVIIDIQNMELCVYYIYVYIYESQFYNTSGTSALLNAFNTCTLGLLD